MAEEKIINRVKKLMALANDRAASDGERDNALRMAYATMAKYNLDAQDVEGKPQGPQEVRCERTAHDVYARPWAMAVANSVSNLFFCRVYYRRSAKKDCAHFSFVGKESNAEAAVEVMSCLVSSIFAEAKRRMRAEGENVTWRRSFCTGAAFKISDRVRDLQTNGVALEDKTARSTALVLVNLAVEESKANELWIVQNVGTMRSAKSRAHGNFKHDAYAQGREFGNSASLTTTKKLGS